MYDPVLQADRRTDAISIVEEVHAIEATNIKKVIDFFRLLRTRGSEVPGWWPGRWVLVAEGNVRGDQHHVTLHHHPVARWPHRRLLARGLGHLRDHHNLLL